AVHRASVGASVGDQPALFDLIEGIDGELTATAPGPLPEQFAELIDDEPGSRWRAWDLWRNGHRVARVIERHLPAPPPAAPATLVLLAIQQEAIDHAPAIYVTVLSEACVSTDAAEHQRCRVQ